MRTCLWAAAIALACLSAPVVAQTKLPPVKDWAGSTVPGSATAIVDKDGRSIDSLNPLPVAGRQEAVMLATANASAVAAAIYGGTYILNQSCAAYGTVTLRYRSADGTTMLTLLTKSAADAGGGSAVQFGSGQVVDVLLAGTTGCNVNLSRIP